MKNKQLIFNICSMTILIFIIIYYLFRFIYYKIESTKKIEYSKVLSERITQEEKNFELTNELTKINNTYYFIDKSKSNYINYKGLIWRIIKINKDKSITIILEDSVNNMPYDSVMKWLNEGNENYTGIFYNTIYNKKDEENQGINYFIEKNELICDKLNEDRIYLLDSNDYIIAGAEDSYLNNKTDFWLSNNKYIDNDGIIYSEEDSNYHNIRPVIILDKDIEISNGNGTIDNPYFIKRDKIETLDKIENNTYIKYNDTLWKVLEIYNDKIKIISESCLKNENDECLSTNFSDNNNKINIHKKDNILYYLNNDYYNNLKNNEYLTKGTFYIGKYTDNNYLSIYTDSIELKIGLPTIADPFAFKLDNTFLITTSINNELNIFVSLDNHPYETLISEKSYIRPVIYLKNNITIKSGDGTYTSPYTLGGLIDEEK